MVRSSCRTWHTTSSSGESGKKPRSAAGSVGVTGECYINATSMQQRVSAAWKEFLNGEERSPREGAGRSSPTALADVQPEHQHLDEARAQGPLHGRQARRS